MAGRRKRQDGLPSRVYFNHGAYYYVQTVGKKRIWHRLCKDRSELFSALDKLLASAGDGSLGAVMDRYELEVLPTKAAKTQTTQRTQLVKLRQVFGHCHPDQVTPGDIADYLDLSPAKVSANREIALLSHIYKKAIRWRKAQSNPCRGVERNKETPRDRYVTHEEYARVWEAAPEPVRLMMDLAYLTGQRESDLLALRWTDCTEDGLLVQQGKTKRKLLINWSPTLRGVIDRARSASKVSMTHIVVGASGKPYTFWGFQGALRRLWALPALADAHRFTFHDIRAKAGSDAKSGEHLGHLDPRTFELVYRRKPKAVQPTL